MFHEELNHVQILPQSHDLRVKFKKYRNAQVASVKEILSTEFFPRSFAASKVDVKGEDYEYSDKDFKNEQEAN